MTSNPWGKFFWNDWENDPALRLCSLAAQGLWMRCLCVCAKSGGYLKVAGRPLDTSDVAVLVSRPETEVAELLAELENRQVFSRDRRGTIYSRRIIRDEKKAKVARKNGKTGGNPNLRKQKTIPPSDNPPGKPGLSKSSGNNHKPEARSQRPEEDIAQHSPTERPRDPERGGAGPGGPYADLRDQLCEAAGWQPQRANGGLEVVGPILALIDAGADLDLDVLPVVRAMAPRCRTPNWKFFIGPIQDAKAIRLAAGETSARSPPVNGNGQRQGGMMGEIQRRLGDDDGDEQGADQGDRPAFHPRRISAPGAGGH